MDSMAPMSLPDSRMDSRINGLDGPNESYGFADHGFAMDSMDSE